MKVEQQRFQNPQGDKQTGATLSETPSSSFSPKTIFDARVPRRGLFLTGASLGLAALNACVRDRTPTPTPAPAKPAAKSAEPAKEREPKPSLVLLPLKVLEGPTITLADKDHCSTGIHGPVKIAADPGWKLVYIEFGIENQSSKTQIIPLHRNTINGAILRSKDGFEYKDPLRLYNQCFGDPDATTTYLGWPEEFFVHALPSGFRIKGVFPGYGMNCPDPNSIETHNRITFKVGEQTSGYQLIMPSLPPLDLTKGIAESLKFPTDRPDKDFKELGTPINVPGKGSITIEDVIKRGLGKGGSLLAPDPRISFATIRICFNNESKGYGQKFNLTLRLFGDDGILYTSVPAKNSSGAPSIFKNQPEFWDGLFVKSQGVAPLTKNSLEVGIPMSLALKSGKLAVGGDINEIFNVQLPPHVP